MIKFFEQFIINNSSNLIVKHTFTTINDNLHLIPYYKENELLMRIIDKIYLIVPVYYH